MFDGAAVVDDAAKWADVLLQRSYRGPGDTIEAASYRAEQRYGVPASTFWALRYRRPKDILASVYLTLKAAYEAECGRQEARLRHELELVKALPATPAREGLIREVEAALGAAEGAAGTEMTNSATLARAGAAPKSAVEQHRPPVSSSRRRPGAPFQPTKDRR